MGNYTFPTNSAQLIALATNMEQGMAALAVPLGLTLISTAQMQANLSVFVSADAAFNAGRSSRQTASDSYQAALADNFVWLGSVKNMLVSRWGTGWSTQWAQAGFINNSTAIPSTNDQRLGLTLSLVAFFTNNPGYELPNLNLTAAYGASLRTAALNAQTALATATQAMKDLGNAWDAAWATLTKGMTALVMNLDHVLDDNDPRWLAFGLQMPSTPSTPGQPVNVSAHVDQTGAIIVQCDPVALANRYRFRMMRLGIDTDYSLAASSPAPIGSISNVLPGQVVQIIVQAVNGSLQGVASDPIVFTVPLPVADVAAVPVKAAGAELENKVPVTASAPAVASAAVVAKSATISSNGNGSNGNGNGNGNGSGNGNGHAMHSRALT